VQATDWKAGCNFKGSLAIAGCEPPGSTANLPAAKPENIVIEVDKDGNIYWNGELVTCAELSTKVAAATPKPAETPDYCELLKQPAPDEIEALMKEFQLKQ
jgi:hypothetical protein